MSDQDPSARRSRTSREIIQEAIRWAVEKGIKVIASANPGVICTSTATCEWEVDRTAEGVNPLGAAILMRQKLVHLSPSIDRACFLAVGESVRWVEGYSAGIAGLKPDPSWQKHPAGPIYSNGWTAGRDVYNASRMRLLVSCRHHPWVSYEANSGCPRCADEDNEPTRPDTRSEQERAEASDPNLITTPNASSSDSGSARA